MSLYLDLAQIALADAAEIDAADPPPFPSSEIPSRAAELYGPDLAPYVTADLLEPTRQAERLIERQQAGEAERLRRLAARLLAPEGQPPRRHP